MKSRNRGRVALIGGGSKGLGLGCALSLARAGANVAICARDKKSLADAARRIRAVAKVKVLPVQADFSRPGSARRAVAKTIAELGEIDILVVNSGGPKAGTFFTLGESDWSEAYQSVFHYVVELYRAVIPGMKKNKWGRIINLTSLSVKEPEETLVLSNVFRAGVVSLAKSISRELIKHNITINNICPGAFRTARSQYLMEQEARRTGLSVQEIERAAIGRLPLGRLQQPEELGEMVAFLASEQARGITGTTIQIDGGISKGVF